MIQRPTQYDLIKQKHWIIEIVISTSQSNYLVKIELLNYKKFRFLNYSL